MTISVVCVRVASPAPRQKDSAPFRFHGLRKSRENCTSAESFFLFQIGPALLGSDLDTGSGSDMDCPGAPKRRESEQDSLLFGGPPSASKDPLRSILARGSYPLLSRSPHSNLEYGSDFDCPGAPERGHLKGYPRSASPPLADYALYHAFPSEPKSRIFSAAAVFMAAIS